MSHAKKVFDPVNDLDDMRSLNIQAAANPGVSVEDGLRQWETLSEAEREAARTAWDEFQAWNTATPGTYMPTND